MALYGDIYDDILEACRGSESDRMKTKVARRINMDYQAIAPMVSWSDMRKKETIDLSAGAVQLPADLIGIDLLWDDTNEIEFLDRQRSETEKHEYAFRYYTYPVGSVLADVSDGAVSQDSTVMTSSGLSTIHATTPLDDEYFYIEGEEQRYQITEEDGGAFTISPAYRGFGTKSGVRIIVRPASTKVLDIVMPTGFLSTTGEVELYYWASPSTLRDASDIVLLPTADVLAMRSLSRLPEAQPHRPVSQKRVDQSLQEAIALNPGKPMPRISRGLHGRAIPSARGAYSSREGFITNRIQEVYQLNRI